ncbi:class I SAM-dependent methyltransferase [Chroococcidiopsis sp. FACHB-1243]|uniref:SAM-dependent methyltransferase n=1 Tax=Chroococcidiopsis sp. [FACHB-1243] TaxID=2692781 RepID=UPI00177CA265|nr:class I SAM-dependent methyltransferase [Chroococcidiopsis sp. [FACHB-1243]]MBD2308240.1 class I SAM-dependent methyltransferase [Chroococcidiopsis sp. [FACHB-1243]]
MTHATLNYETAPGHEVLAAAGKKYLRPGGRLATEQLFQWANFQPGETVLELAASFGLSAIAIAQRYGVRVVGIEKNPDSVVLARANVATAGLSDRVEIIEGDIFHLDRLTEKFDYVLAEAILTMQSPPGKAKILAGIRDRLKPGGKFLSHELLAQNREAEIHRALAQAIRVNSTPLSESSWIAACKAAGLTVQQHQTGEMGLLKPQQMLADEGIFNSICILWNILTRSQIRQRVLTMRQVFQKYRQDLGYIILSAVRS